MTSIKGKESEESDFKKTNPIRCTFEECYQRFPSVEAMKKHKAKAQKNKDEHIHDFYCKKCDEDSTDDIERLIHQIQSPKHIVCPACGEEFGSESGRDRHVSIYHRQQQSLKCPGCKSSHTSASSLIGHIEKNECRIIKRDDFYRQRAEQQIERDALEELQGGMLHGTSTRSQIDAISSSDGVSLLDDRRVHVERDWQGAPLAEQESQPEGNDTNALSNFSQAMSDMDLDKYRPLNPTRAASNLTGPTRRRYEMELDPNTNTDKPTAAPADLLDISDVPEVNAGRSILGNSNNNVWSVREADRAWRTKSSNLLDSTSSVNLLDSSVIGQESVATRGTRPSQADYRSSFIPPAARPESTDPNAPNAQIQIRPQMRMLSRENLQRYYDSITATYVCPGAKCGQQFPSPEAFEAHLISDVHSGGRVQCPCCYKKFKTTQGLVAHAESGSVRCELRRTEDFDLAIQQITGGIIRVQGNWSETANPKFEAVPVDQW